MCAQEGGASVDHVKPAGLSNQQLSWIHSAGVGAAILPDNILCARKDKSSNKEHGFCSYFWQREERLRI